MILSLFIVGLSLFSYHTASADSYAVAGSYNSSARITVTLDKTTYLSGEQIKVTASADTYTNVSTVSVTVSNGITSNNIIPQTSATVSSAAATLTAEAAPGTAYGVSVDATVSGIPTVFISPSYGHTISSVSGITGFTLPAATRLNYYGTHTAFTGGITISISPTASFPAASVELRKGNTRIDCQLIDNASNAMRDITFPSADYLSTDIISIASLSEPGSCF